MPSTRNPGDIRVGAGSSKAETMDGVPVDDTLVQSHVNQPSAAHAASAITHDDEPPILSSPDVEGALDELTGLVPPLPPSVGDFRTFLGFSGIPDWGVLKLNDSSLSDRTTYSWGDDSEAFSYYYRSPEPADEDPPFNPLGADPATDLIFNIDDGGYEGGGEGKCYAGAFTRTGPEMLMTQRVMPYVTAGRPVVMSGAVYPADKGVLALIRWPANGDMTAFLAQGLTTRCIAATLLGNGIESGCNVGATIFSPGLNTSGDYDPFAYPGRASGQYDLLELHTGLSNLTGNPLPAPYSPGNTAAGQVRLGTSPASGIVVANGIPILGGTSVARGGGNDNNFFRYRLPYLRDYSDTDTGIKYTPSVERDRYFEKPAISYTPGTNLTQAGDYQNFDHDYWTAQVARYRHTFDLDTTATTPEPRESGTIILLHFKREEIFEEFVRDGTLPADEDLFSPNLVNWTDPEAPENIAEDNATAGNPIAPCYHNIRSVIVEDPRGALTPGFPGPDSWGLNRTAGYVLQVSGIDYFYAADASSRFQARQLDMYIQDIFLRSYRTAEPGIAGDTYIGNINPAVLFCGCFSYSEIGGTPTMTANTDIVKDPANGVRRQRVEFTLEDFGYSLSSPPPTTTNVEYIGWPNDPLAFLGDLEEPSFSQDARFWYFVRRPLGHASISVALMPQPINSISETGGNTILFHSTRNDSPVYGNFTSGSVAVASVETAEKDVHEKFLDEVYRYWSSWSGIASADAARLNGPGLPGGPSAIDVPVRAGSTVSFVTASWLQQGRHQASLPADEAQVAGLPARAPRLSSEAQNAFPSRGMLMYPKIDYSTGYRPSVAAGDIGVPQPNYGTYPGTGDRVYVRCFDVGFTRSSSPITPEGSALFTIRIYGLRLSDFEYSASGPGSTACAIMIKIPGLTTWMDLGRPDGSGPSKQDTFLDGAGCQIVGTETFDDLTEDQLYYAQVRVHVGPSAALFRNTTDNEVPILVKAIIKDTSDGRDLDFSLNSGSYSSNPSTERALMGIEIIRPTS